MQGVFRAGHAGVDFFFVLSGFIIAFVHHGDVGRPASAIGYAWRRIIRIYPIYWIALGLMAPLVLLGVVDDEPQLLADLLLLPQHQAPLLGVAWTLQHELLFYVVFGVAIVNRGLGIALFGGWLLLIVGGCLRASGAPWAPNSLLWDFLGAPFHLQFLAGTGVAYAVLANSVPAPRALLVAGIVGIVGTAMLEDSGLVSYLGLVSQLLFGGFAACAIAGMATAERKGTLNACGAAVLVGEASYSIYLVHFPAIAALRAVLIGSGAIHAVPGVVVMMVLVVGGVGAGIALHLVAERPILRWLRSFGRITVEGTRHAARETA
jgi:peptidoglycan/LPS O-acetylase OafA/YrhL